VLKIEGGAEAPPDGAFLVCRDVDVKSPELEKGSDFKPLSKRYHDTALRIKRNPGNGRGS
jgi:hypothetical protein